MRNRFFLIMIMVLLTDLTSSAEVPVLVADFTVDTSLYAKDPPGRFFRHSPGPMMEWNENQSPSMSRMMVYVFRKKNSTEVDIYSYAGKIGTSIVPFLSDSNAAYCNVSLSCYFIDSDDKWESLVKYSDADGGASKIRVYDDDGTELLTADNGIDAGYGFDGMHTYVTVLNDRNVFSMKTWRFRTNIAAALPQDLGKKRQQAPVMQLYGFSEGAYRVTLSREGGSNVSFQIFDLLGRCTFTKKIDNLNGSVSFMVPEQQVPNSMFLGKASSGGTTTVKSQTSLK